MIELWLDDERDPTDPYIQEEFGARDGMVWVKTAWAAISRLKDNNVSFISLDHDLGSGAGTGEDVAKWIEEQAYHGKLSRLDWSVHSMNIVGTKNIMAALFNANKYWEKENGQNG